MRIGFDAKRIFHNFRGLGNYSRTLVEGLAKYYPDNEYVLFTPGFKDAKAQEWNKRFNSFEVVKPGARLDKTFSSAWRSLFMGKDVAKHSIDVFHGLSHEIPPGLAKRSIKSVVTIHDLIFMRYPNFFPWVDRQVYFRKFKFAIENADIVVAICEQTKSDLIYFLNCPEEKIRVIHQATHPIFYSQLEQDTKEAIIKKYDISGSFILYVGAIEERKNALSLVQAFKELPKKFDQKLVLIGQGKEYRNKIESFIDENNLGDRIIILDNVGFSDLPAFYQCADLFVYPSLFEGWGIPNVEALFSETPVITSTGSCFSESAGPGSIYVDPYSIEQLSEKIKDVLDDSSLQSQMSGAGRNYADQFHWAKTSANMINLYKEVLAL